MKTFFLKRKYWSIILIGLVSILSTLENQSLAQQKVDQKIVFLSLRFKDNNIILQKTSMKPGTLKQQRITERRSGIRYKVVSASGATLWQTTIDDPMIQRFEYEDPGHAGQLKTKIVKLNDVEFSIRFPYDERIHHITFNRVEPLTLEQPKQNSNLKFLGTIELNLKGGGQR